MLFIYGFCFAWLRLNLHRWTDDYHPSPYSYILYTMMLFFNAVLREGTKVTAIGPAQFFFFFYKVVKFTPSCLWMAAFWGCSCQTQSWHCLLLLFNLFPCVIFRQVFFKHSITIPVFYYPCCNMFGNVFGIKFRKSKRITFISLKVSCLVL